jgi:hypothetical protein
MNTVSGANGPLGVDALGARGLHGRGDDAHLLVAEQPAFAGMRVQPRHRDARRRRPRPRRRWAMRRVCSTASKLRRRWPAQRHVDGHQHHAQFVVGQHHAHRRRGRRPASACSISVWPG